MSDNDLFILIALIVVGVVVVFIVLDILLRKFKNKGIFQLIKGIFVKDEKEEPKVNVEKSVPTPPFVEEEKPVEEPVKEEVVEPVKVEEPVVEVQEEVIEPVKVEEPVVEVQEEPKEEVRPVVKVEPKVVESKEEDDDDFDDDDEDEGFAVINGANAFGIEYVYSFTAKLSWSSDEVKEQYNEIIHAFKSYGMKVSRSWKNDRIYLGRKTYALVLFRGRKLCIAYALNPATYEETKYRGIDVSEIKRFENTPLLVKNTSHRRFGYMLELIDIMLGETLQKKEIEKEHIDIPYQTLHELLKQRLVKKYNKKTGMEIPASVDVETAQASLTDDEAVAQVFVEERKSFGRTKGIINIDTLSQNYEDFETVDLESLHAKKLIAKKVDYVKVLARGALEKSLIVKADDFSVDAIKMIVLTGGQVYKLK